MGDKFGSIDLFKLGGVKALELKKNHLFKAIFVLKSLNQLIALFRVLNFSAASFNSVTSSGVTVLNLDAVAMAIL